LLSNDHIHGLNFSQILCTCAAPLNAKRQLLLTAISVYMWRYVRDTRMTHHNISLIILRIQHYEQQGSNRRDGQACHWETKGAIIGTCQLGYRGMWEI